MRERVRRQPHSHTQDTAWLFCLHATDRSRYNIHATHRQNMQKPSCLHPDFTTMFDVKLSFLVLLGPRVPRMWANTFIK